MSTIPVSLTENVFNQHVNPYLSKAKRGYVVCKIPLYKVFNYIPYRLHTGCQWDQLPIPIDPDTAQCRKKEISHDAVYQREFGLGNQSGQGSQSERRFLGLPTVGDQPTNQVDQEVCRVSMALMFNLGDVLEPVNDRFDNDSFSKQEFVHQGH